MRLSVHYSTTYRYDRPTTRVIQLLRVTPSSFSGQTVIDWRIDMDCDARLRESRDGYGNIIHMLYVDHPVRDLTVTVTGKVLTEDRAGLVDGLPHDLPPQIFLRHTPLTQTGPALEQFAADLAGRGGTDLDRLHRLSSDLHSMLKFDTGMTVADTTAAEALAAGHGVCQDFAHIFISVARTLGIPARYVSGHLFRRDGQVYQEAAHAWAEAWMEHLGWIAFDPANGICADDAYIRVAAGLDYQETAPFAGSRSGGGAEELEVAVQVRLARAQSQSQSQN